MTVYLGNLSIEDIERRLGIQLSADCVEYMQDKRQQNAGKLAKDKWHCFDMPFVLVCENREMATVIYNHLKPFSEDMKTPLQIAIG